MGRSGGPHQLRRLPRRTGQACFRGAPGRASCRWAAAAFDTQRVEGGRRMPVLHRSPDDLEFDADVVSDDWGILQPFENVVDHVLDLRRVRDVALPDAVNPRHDGGDPALRFEPPVLVMAGQQQTLHLDDGEFNDLDRRSAVPLDVDRPHALVHSHPSSARPCRSSRCGCDLSCTWKLVACWMK